jgi:hypothetical protein
MSQYEYIFTRADIFSLNLSVSFLSLSVCLFTHVFPWFAYSSLFRRTKYLLNLRAFLFKQMNLSFPANLPSFFPANINSYFSVNIPYVPSFFNQYMYVLFPSSPSLKASFANFFLISLKPNSFHYFLVMSKTKGQTFRYRFGNENKTFWYRSRISLIENRLFRFSLESALLGQIERISFDNTNSGDNSIVFCFIPIRYRNVYITFVNRLLLYCFDITAHPSVD